MLRLSLFAIAAVCIAATGNPLSAQPPAAQPPMAQPPVAQPPAQGALNPPAAKPEAVNAAPQTAEEKAFHEIYEKFKTIVVGIRRVELEFQTSAPADRAELAKRYEKLAADAKALEPDFK